MKKLIVLALCAVFCVMLCSCGEEAEEKTETTAAAAVQATTSGSQSATKATDAQSGDSSDDGSSPYESAKEAAVAEAKKLLETSAYSYDGLVAQLQYMGYAPEDAAYGADNCGADWNEQAKARAKSLLQTMEYNYDNFVEKLESEGFTHDQAVTGAQSAADSQSSDSGRYDEAVSEAKNYIAGAAYSYNGLIDQLVADGYSYSEAQYGADNCGANWNEQAAALAQKYIQKDAVATKEELVDMLLADGFTYEQAVYGAESNGF